MENLKVICFLGPSAAGKTSATSALSKQYDVLKESYMDLNKHNLDNRLMLSKWVYLNHWFNSVISIKENGNKLLLTDRCPIDTCAYVKNGSDSLLNTLLISFEELKPLGITPVKILVTAEFDILQNRINERLKTEERRQKYNEGDIEHNKRAYSFYQTNSSLWDETIDTSSLSKDKMLDRFNSVILKYSLLK